VPYISRAQRTHRRRGTDFPGAPDLATFQDASAPITATVKSFLMNDPLNRWSEQHALLMSLGIGGALLEKSTLLVAAMAAGSFFGLLIRGRGRFTESGRFGLANGITLAWVLGAVGLLLVADANPGWLASLVALLVGAKGLAGWAAQGCGMGSAFSRLFEQEGDAFLLLVACLLLFSSGRFGGWILLPGALPYGFMLLRQVARRPLSAAWGDYSSRTLGVMATLGFAACLLPVMPASAALWLALAISSALAGSFVYALAFLYRSKRA
jgi:hypothetical protein